MKISLDCPFKVGFGLSMSFKKMWVFWSWTVGWQCWQRLSRVMTQQCFGEMNGEYLGKFAVVFENILGCESVAYEEMFDNLVRLSLWDDCQLIDRVMASVCCFQLAHFGLPPLSFSDTWFPKISFNKKLNEYLINTLDENFICICLLCPHCH